METKTPQRDSSDAKNYVKSLRDAVKRRYANEYLAWILAGRTGVAPGRGRLSPVLWKAVCANLDALA
ncbi:hypothetical protein [Fimbriimonas ginsengisoli]|uniref:Uncharacterized protein n=1 Tax=Fimbriimonas ginsengisoli Gsoil 348 TaxID=661478 RepID=A0A068NSZ5_FIMGI|nr:hypothetical protein [Fimbriimonas ginsengisoli]AIE85895.1 hypothetical protein OP10G_2527 [Fimbriimonas ginsengisoli Gsoil 348]